MTRPVRVLALAAVLAVVSLSTAYAQGGGGHLVVIGGGTRPASINTLIARLAGGAQGRLLVFPQASAVAGTGPDLAAEFRALGLGTVIVITADHAAADTDAVLRQTDGATGVYFAGGDQNRLMAVLRGTKLEARLRTLYRDGAVIAGTSAGAAVMSRVMITGDEQRPLTKDQDWQTIEADNVVTAPGLGLLDDVVVDQHFVRRRRHNRLISLVLEQPALLGVAIDEETATWVKPDRTFEVVGNGPVVVFDAKGATTTRDTAGPGLRGSDLRLHVLRAGAVYDLGTRTVRRNAPTP
ncbi:MAG: cyanophycinase [Acidobacteria bacterium]|nr:cyanophycinase [Acidobacteriota bacterium]